MPLVRGLIALIGSGELSGTMVETHKMLLSRNSAAEKTLFLDTPAGFQENVDMIAKRAADYFTRQVGRQMEVASFKSAETITSAEAEKVYRLLSEAGFVLIGPGSPTYIIRQLKETPVPALLSAMVTRGGCLVAASAAALSVGSHTLPVYEIYKVGETLHWVNGLNILGNLDLDLVVIPHWNNAEGGNHDTRFCYMGEKRFRALEAKLAPDTAILGLDEHTVCIIDFSSREACVGGLGKVTIRRGGLEQHYRRGEKISFEQLRGTAELLPEGRGIITADIKPMNSETLFEPEQDTLFWGQLHNIETAFYRSLEQQDVPSITAQLLEADKLLWQAQLDLENPEFISQGRELFREMIVLAGTGINQMTNVIPRKFTKLMDELIKLREKYRRKQRWSEADQIRSLLQSAGLVIEDTEEGPKWHL
jgi:cyanophycinase-like exopeptidase